MREIFESDTIPGKFGVVVGEAIEYEAEFTEQEARDIVSAHNAGAQTSNNAMEWIEAQRCKKQ